MFIDHTKMESTRFVAIGPFCWGIGKTLTKAVDNAKANWSLDGKPSFESFSIYVTDAKEIRIGDADGAISVEEGATLHKLQKGGQARG